ncbi:MAG: YggT family protein [Deltaproteobacteria bacterium]|nr:YggT family protein [Deltaproteobacteria bacterium]
MFVVANFLMGVAQVLNVALSLCLWLVVARAILSWVNPDPYNPIVRFLRRSTDPVLSWIRRKIPVVYGGIDFSPLLVILVIYFLKSFAVASLFDLATRLH